MSTVAITPPVRTAAAGPALSAADAARARALSNAQARPAGFALLAVQLAALLYVAYALNVEGPLFFRALAISAAGFAVHYFAPFALKRVVFLSVAFVTGVIIVGQPEPDVAVAKFHFLGSAMTVGLAGGLALAFFGILRGPIPFNARIALAIVLAAAIGWLRWDGSMLPAAHWPVLCTLFMFRLIVFAYDMSNARGPESIWDYLTYIFLPPNFYFLLFPVVDYATFKRSFYADDIHRTAQRGITLITRGFVQLGVYRLVYHLLVIDRADVVDPPSLVQFILPAYLLYTRISGQFHIAIGMLHLFGYNLPDANRSYLLADSFTDFWRRINIYWKDFMVKVFYYPTYFRLRKKNEKLAVIVATLVVFTATTVLHGYQWFWLQGAFRVTQSDLVFWGLLGVLVMFTVLRETTATKSAARKPTPLPLRMVRTLGVYLTISVLWSMWSSGSVRLWLDTIAYWKS